MKNFTLRVFTMACILFLTGFSVAAQNVVDLSGIDNPDVLGDTLPVVAGGTVILLDPGMTYNIGDEGYAFDKSIEFRSSDPTSSDLPRIDCSENFNLVDGANVDSVIFKNIAFDNGIDGFANRYVFNIDNSGTIGEMRFESCQIRSLRGIVRIKDGVGTLNKFTVSNCIVDSLNNYGVLYIDKDTWQAGDILLENSTFSKIIYFLASRSNSNSVTIESCTINETPDVGRQMFRWRGGDGENDIINGLKISNTIWGPGWDTDAEGVSGVKGFEGLSNTTIDFQNTYATSDFSFSSDTLDGFPNVTYAGTAAELWVDPLNIDFNFLDSGFAGKSDAGDPRWALDAPTENGWNISSESFNALGDVTETVTINGLTIYANSDKDVTIDENSKSLEGMEFTHRLKLGGSGQFDETGIPTGRVLSFEVTGSTIITVIGMSSSGSADRELVIAADSMNNEIARFPALGESITKGKYSYVGGATTIYLFSPSSGVNLYYIEAAPFVPDEQEWNISWDVFNGLGEITDEINVEGLTIFASADKKTTVDESSKTLDAIEFTYRLKLGGSGVFGDDGMPVSRVLSFEVNGSSTITVIGMSSSSSSDRELVIAAGDKDTEVARFPALGESISKGVYNYIGEPTTIFLYSPSSGVNLYYIKKETLMTSITTHSVPSIKIYPNPATYKVYVKVTEPTEIGIYNISGNMVVQKSVYSSTDYINISNLPTGLYFVKSMNNESVSQKLLVR